MFGVHKIATVVITVLISCLNSGILKTSFPEDSLRGFEKGCPTEQTITVLNLFLSPVPEVNARIKLTNVLSQKLNQNIKFPVWLKTSVLVNKNHLHPISYEDIDPNKNSDLFNRSDISFPFKFFW
jgi:hypothetical protein